MGVELSNYKTKLNSRPSIGAGRGNGRHDNATHQEAQPGDGEGNVAVERGHPGDERINHTDHAAASRLDTYGGDAEHGELVGADPGGGQFL